MAYLENVFIEGNNGAVLDGPAGTPATTCVSIQGAPGATPIPVSVSGTSTITLAGTSTVSVASIAGTPTVEVAGVLGTSTVTVAGIAQVSPTSAANTRVNPFFTEITDGTSTMGAMVNFGSNPGAVPALNANVAVQQGTIAVAGTSTVTIAGAVATSQPTLDATPLVTLTSANALLGTNFAVFTNTNLYNELLITFTGTGTLSTGVVNFQVSQDGSDWLGLPGYATQQYPPTETSSFTLADGTFSFKFDISGWSYFRLAVVQALTGSGTVAVNTVLTGASYTPPSVAVGTSTVTVVGTSTVTVAGTVTAACSGTQTVTVAGTVTAACSGTQTVTVAGTVTAACTGTQTVTVSGIVGTSTVEVAGIAGTPTVEVAGILGTSTVTVSAIAGTSTVEVAGIVGTSTVAIAGTVMENPASVLGTATVINSSNGTLNATFNIATGVGVPAVLVQLDQTTTITAGAINFQVTYDGINWAAVSASQIVDPTAGFVQIATPYTLQPNTNKAFLILMHGAQGLRIIVTTQMTGTGTITPVFALLPYLPTQDVIIDGTPTVTVTGSITTSAPTGTQTVEVAGIVGTSTVEVAGIVGTSTVTVAGTSTTALSGQVAGAAGGTGVGGTAASSSVLTGLVYNTPVLALTNSQQASLQGDAAGNLRVNPYGGIGSFQIATATFTGTATGGVEAQLNIPLQTKWVLKSLVLDCVGSGANSSTRVAYVFVTNSALGNVVYSTANAGGGTFSATASTAMRVVCAPGLPNSPIPANLGTSTGTTVMQLTMPELVLGPNFFITAFVASLASGTHTLTMRADIISLSD